MRIHRTALLISCFSLLALACGGGGGSGSPPATDSTFTVYGSARATAGAAALAMTTAGSPTSLLQTFYKGWVSTSADCSDPVLIEDLGSSGKSIEFYDDPIIFEGSPPDGTYRCIIVEVSDTMRFTPDAAAEAAFPGVCSTGTASDMDTFKTGDDNRVLLGSTDPQVGEGAPGAAVPQHVDIFISTDPSAVAAARGAGLSQIVQLLAPLVAPGQTTFYADFAGLVGNLDGHCWLEKGAVGFR